MRCGCTVVMQTPGSGNPIPHLWFVITEPDPTSHLCGIVSLTSLKAGKDQTVTLGPSDHSYISHPSVIHYAGSKIVDVRKLKALIDAGTIQQHDDCDAVVLKLIQSGVSASPYSAKKFIQFCKEAWSRRR
jgi:hypothetical protein